VSKVVLRGEIQAVFLKVFCIPFCIQEDIVCTFFANGKEIVSNLQDTLTTEDKGNTEKIIQIVYQPQALFRVKAITRCTRLVYFSLMQITHRRKGFVISFYIFILQLFTWPFRGYCCCIFQSRWTAFSEWIR